ncbi:MAG: hypothetical protein KA533_09000 [Sphingobium sp.]|nr:hypothetical protein [Sphingobium sp.]MBP6112321.1 hypothetical protein [Sphingobium sp.]MBP8670092.1 hypothetical protein [Sphingobium sp.]MBP9157403.1 hypothetical protein [Sphingobium sp.]MCC6482308.1 hypothetical protein [Sphingomonadaceae bacterium]
MAEYREDTVRHDRRTGGAGRIVLIVALVAAIIAGLLFATGFWTADVKEGSLPDVDVSAKGGDLPDVNVDSKEIVVGTKKETIDVPTVGVKDDGDK